MTNFQLRSYRWIIPVFGALLFCRLVYAAPDPSFYFDTAANEIAPDSVFTVKILIDSEVPLNAYRLIVQYPKNLLTFERFDNSRSIIDVWQKQPPAPPFDDEIELVGGNLKPFTGRGGEIGAIIFKAVREGEVAFALPTAEAYIADGRGTLAESSSGSFALRIVGGAELLREDLAIDKTPPKLEVISLGDDPFNSEQKLLSVAVKDRESGVKETQVRSLKWFFWSELEVAGNTVAVDKNVWAINIRIIDNAGNLTAQVIYTWPAFFKNVLPVLAGLVLVLIGIFFFFRRRENRLA